MKLDYIFKNIIKKFGVDYIVEKGTSGIWTYRKWNSGVKECWGITDNITVNYDTDVAQYLKYASNGVSVNLPSGLFSSIKSSQASGYDTGSTGWVTVASCYTTTTKVKLNPLGWNTGGNRTQKFYIYVIGI